MESFDAERKKQMHRKIFLIPWSYCGSGLINLRRQRNGRLREIGSGIKVDLEALVRNGDSED